MWNIYLSGEIHTDWREQIISRCEALKLPVNFSSAITDHAASDAAGDHLADTATSFWRDNQSAKVNAIRTKNLIAQADIAIIRFGDQYKQWMPLLMLAIVRPWVSPLSPCIAKI